MYKIQNCNDSYLVASGVPASVGKQLGPKHAEVIANMALDIWLAATRFRGPHKIATRLVLRAGIHTGGAIGGLQVSGESIGRMPRYK